MSRRGHVNRHNVGCFFASLTSYLIGLLSGIFLSVLGYYYCCILSIAAVIAWVVYILGGLARRKTWAIMLMTVYTSFCVLVHLVVVGVFAWFTVTPDNGPFCHDEEVSSRGDDFEECDLSDCIVVLCVYTGTVLILLVCALVLSRHRKYMLRHPRCRSQVFVVPTAQVYPTCGAPHTVHNISISPQFQVIPPPATYVQQPAVPAAQYPHETRMTAPSPYGHQFGASPYNQPFASPSYPYPQTAASPYVQQPAVSHPQTPPATQPSEPPAVPPYLPPPPYSEVADSSSVLGPQGVKPRGTLSDNS